MKSAILTRTGVALGAGALLAVGTALPAHAHVSVTADSTAAGSHAVLSFTVPHGCDGSPTTAIAIELPEQLVAATPTVVAGWDVEKVTEELAAPEQDAHGNEVSERVARVVYTSTTGGLADGFRAVFDVQVTLPDVAPGTELGFPVTQTCVEGDEVWDGDSLPAVTVTAGNGNGHRHGDMPADAPETEQSDGVASEPDRASTDSVDPLARVFGIAGVVIAAVGLVVAIANRRPKADS